MGVLGNVAGRRLEDLGIKHPVIGSQVGALRAVVAEVERNDTAVQLLGIPLIGKNQPRGAIVLLRDITELRLRDRLLVSKDATIREIHHRVKTICKQSHLCYVFRGDDLNQMRPNLLLMNQSVVSEPLHWYTKRWQMKQLMT